MNSIANSQGISLTHTHTAMRLLHSRVFRRIMNFFRSFFNATPTRHRIYAQTRYASELNPIISLTSVKNVPLILNFSAPWCSTCHQQKPTILEALNDTEGRLDYVEIKADEAEMADYLIRFGVKTFPTLVSIRREFMSGDLQVRGDTRKTGPCKTSYHCTDMLFRKERDSDILRTTSDTWGER